MSLDTFVVPTAAGRSGLLRLALKLDAVASGASAALLVAGAPLLDSALGAPVSFLLPVGLFLVGWAAAVWYAGSRTTISRTAAWAIVGLNALWVVDSVALLLAGWYPLTGLGVAFVIAQAVAVLAFAELQFVGLRRTR